jgi:hypothetical protein
MVMSIGWNPVFGNAEKSAEPWILAEFDEVGGGLSRWALHGAADGAAAGRWNGPGRVREPGGCRPQRAPPSPSPTRPDVLSPLPFPSPFTARRSASWCAATCGPRCARSAGWRPVNAERPRPPSLPRQSAAPAPHYLTPPPFPNPKANFTSLEALVARIHQDGAEAKAALAKPPLAAHAGDTFLAPSSGVGGEEGAVAAAAGGAPRAAAM